MLATNVVLIFGTVFLSLGNADEKVGSESLEDELERCQTKGLELNKKLIEFKFQIIELQGKLALIKELQNTIEVNERQLKSSEEALKFCHKMAETSKNNSKECQHFEPTKGIKLIPTNDTNGTNDPNDTNNKKNEEVDKSTNSKKDEEVDNSTNSKKDEEVDKSTNSKKDEEVDKSTNSKKDEEVDKSTNSKKDEEVDNSTNSKKDEEVDKSTNSKKDEEVDKSTNSKKDEEVDKSTNSKKDEEVDISTNCDSLGFTSGLLTLKYVGADPFSVYCDGDTAGPGWILIQQRIDGAVDFYKNWDEYRDGFGDVTGEHFIGLQKLYMMTNYKPHELYIQLTDFKDEIFYAHYENFQIGNEMEMYKLKKLGKMTGNVANKLVDHLGHKFSTHDMDNDNSSDNIAVRYHGGWWFFESIKRYGCNLNGKYLSSPSTTDPHRLHWQWKSYKGVKMLIHPIRN
ncbi:ryncolin-1-like [Drosophila nasuta]|uniref:ryncolin-1-like n=1 Tax=Drosophila nasuta TaxID=42062 RepID=UPI00295EE10C|nr:ryncolin-1-like [Drosophila nasuta]